MNKRNVTIITVFLSVVSLLFVSTVQAERSSKGKKKKPSTALCQDLGKKDRRTCVNYCQVKQCTKSSSPECKKLRKTLQKKLNIKKVTCSMSIVPELQISANANVGSGAINSVFNLSASALPAKQIKSIKSWSWDFGDGRTATGERTEVSYSAAGIYNITLTAHLKNKKTLTTEIGLIVLDNSLSGPPQLGLPSLPGDVDGDGVITIVDAHKLAKHVSRLESLPTEERARADRDYNAKLEQNDALVISQQLADGGNTPTLMQPPSGSPGTLVNLFSPNLMNPADLIEIEVGASLVKQKPVRYVPGHITFIIPLDPISPGSMVAAAGPVEVRILVNGNKAETFTFWLMGETIVPENPREELEKLLTNIEDLSDELQQIVTDQTLQANVSPEQKKTIDAFATAATKQASQVATKMRQILLTKSGDDIAHLFYLFGNANGLAEATAELEPTVRQLRSARMARQNMALDINPDLIIATLCGIKGTFETLEKTSEYIGYACDLLAAVTIGAIIVPVDGPLVDIAALTAWVAQCSTLELSTQLFFTVGGIVTEIDPDVRLITSTDAPQPGESVKLHAQLELVGVDDLCAIVGSKASDVISERIAKYVVGRALHTSLVLKTASKVLKYASENVLESFIETIEGHTATIVSSLGIDSAIAALTEPYCDNVNSHIGITLNARDVIRGPSPMEGEYTVNSDGTANYSCDPNGTASTITFTASKLLCGETQVKEAKIKCSSSKVTITIGDNGSALDDIYEIVINGKTVLTSSQPTRSTSVTISLPKGETVVKMLGRAAPDGIGTYFVNFVGATVTGGDPLSGSDLTPGVTKTFTINVQ